MYNLTEKVEDLVVCKYKTNKDLSHLMTYSTVVIMNNNSNNIDVQLLVLKRYLLYGKDCYSSLFMEQIMGETKTKNNDILSYY